MSILSVNAGSSSLKFALYPVTASSAKVSEAEMTGSIEGLEPSGNPTISWEIKGQQKIKDAVVLPKGTEPFDAALLALKNLLATHFSHIALQAIAHRVVHGGSL